MDDKHVFFLDAPWSAVASRPGPWSGCRNFVSRRCRPLAGAGHRSVECFLPPPCRQARRGSIAAWLSASGLCPLSRAPSPPFHAGFGPPFAGQPLWRRRDFIPGRPPSPFLALRPPGSILLAGALALWRRSGSVSAVFPRASLGSGPVRGGPSPLGSGLVCWPFPYGFGCLRAIALPSCLGLQQVLAAAEPGAGLSSCLYGVPGEKGGLWAGCAFGPGGSQGE